jgi:hypothetical protein
MTNKNQLIYSWPIFMLLSIGFASNLFEEFAGLSVLALGVY